jgi:hypothetical protein
MSLLCLVIVGLLAVEALATIVLAGYVWGRYGH